LMLRGPSGLFYFIAVNLVCSLCLFLYSLFFLALTFYCVLLHVLPSGVIKIDDCLSNFNE